MYNYKYYVDTAKRVITPEMIETFLQICYIALAVYLVMYLVKVISCWIIFKKTGKKAWVSLIPIYNIITLYRVANLSPGLIILFVIPIVNIFAFIVLKVAVSVKLTNVFGKGAIYALGLLFIPIIFLPMLAFRGENIKLLKNTN